MLNFKTKHADFAAKLIFFSVLAGLVFIAYAAGGVDFRGYYAAAVLVIRGGNPYDYSQLAPILAEVTGFAGNNPYFYPPWFTLFFIPFTLLPFQIARLIWLVLNGAFFYISLRTVQKVLDWDISGWRKWTVYLVATLLFAAYCLRSEQVGIVLLLFLSALLFAVKHKNYALAGLSLILFASKPQATIGVVLLIAVWMFVKQRRSFYWAAGWTVGLTVLSTLAIPNWWLFDRSNFGAGLAYELDGPEQVAAVRLLSTLYDFSTHILSISAPIQYILAAIISLLGVALLWIAWQQTGALVPTVSAALILTLLVTPYALQYDYVPLVVPFLWTLRQFRRLDAIYRWGIVVLFTLSMSILLWQEWAYQGYLQLLAVAAAFAMALYAITVRETATTIYQDAVLND